MTTDDARNERDTKDERHAAPPAGPQDLGDDQLAQVNGGVGLVSIRREGAKAPNTRLSDG